MSVVQFQQPSGRMSDRRTTKAWACITKEQKLKLDAMAKANHMSTSEYMRVVLSFAIAENWRFTPDKASA